MRFFRRGGIYNPDTIDPMPSTDREPPDLPYIPASVPSPAAPIPPVAPKLPDTAPFAPMVVKWAGAIKIWEGARVSSNNPGNLKYSSLTARWGGTKGRPATDGGFFCQFATPQAGMDALCRFLTLGAKGELIISKPRPCTLERFMIKYAGNPPRNYIVQIAKILDVPLTVDIATFLS